MNFLTQSYSDFVYQYNGKQTNPNNRFADFSSCDHASRQNNSEISLRDQRKNDRDFINSYVSNIVKSKNTLLKHDPLKIFEGKNFLLEIIALKKKLEISASNLCVDDDEFDVRWEVIMKEMNAINENIVKFDKDLKIPLKATIVKRLKRRKSLKKKLMRMKELKEVAKKEIQEKHKIIDKLLSERSDEVEAVKRESALKRQADTVLHEVRKKKYEAKKMLNMLLTLAKLRGLRSKQEEEQGGYCSKQLTETFNEVIDRFQNLWQKQINVYKLEEKGLKIMLEENSMPSVKESKFETNLLQWEKVLFGDVSTDENAKLLTMADDNIQFLIQVRREWDQFLVKESATMASSIPLGWILPPETDNKEWKALIQNDRKILPQEEKRINLFSKT